MLGWIGGKSKLTSAIIPHIPPHKTYVEVFAGAAWLLFRKDPSKVEVLNDINSELVTLYRVVQYHLPELLRYFEWALVSRDEFERLKQVEPRLLTDVQRAARFYYVMRMAFGSRLMHQSFALAKTHGARLNFETMEQCLSAARERLARVTVENLPYEQIIPRLDAPETFFYCDPPYWDCEDYYGKGIFNKDDFTRLRDVLASAKGKWLVSINNVEQIRDLFKGFHFKEVQTVYTVNDKASQQVTELLISNYPLDGDSDG